MEREQRRRLKKKQKLFANEEEEMAHMIAVEERKLVIAQRKLESIRILDELLERVKVIRNVPAALILLMTTTTTIFVSSFDSPHRRGPG